MVFPFTRPGRLVAEGGMRIRRMLVGHPSRQGTHEGKGARPLLQPKALLVPGPYAARWGRVALGGDGLALQPLKHKQRLGLRSPLAVLHG
jgi:hypothetical protein